MVLLCLNAQCHLFCRFHYASNKKTSARPSARMFSRSNYPLNDPLKATEREESSASSRPELLIHHPGDGSKHHEPPGGGRRKQHVERRGGEDTTLRDFLLILLFFLFNGTVVLCHMSVYFRRENVDDTDSFMLATSAILQSSCLMLLL